MCKLKVLYKYLDICYFLISIFFVYNIKVGEYDKNTKCLLGVGILFFSIMLVVKYRHDTLYTILFGIMLYINFSLVVSDCFMDGTMSLMQNTLSWQKYRNTYYEIYLVEGILLFMATLNVFQWNSTYSKKINEYDFKNKDNIFVFVISYVFLMYIWFDGYYTISSIVYQSNTKALYEYALIFFILTWYYAGNHLFRHIILLGYGILYCGQALIYGDRSSAFPMIIIIFILYFRNISAKRIIPLAFLGIVFANIISVYRQTYSFSNFFDNYFSRYGLFNFTSDTVSQSYYTGISLMAVRDMIGNTTKFFKDFVIGIVLGGDYGKANVTNIGKQFATNKGGGLLVSDFMFWFGLLGAVIIGVIIAIFLRKLSQNRKGFTFVWSIYFIATVLRWYLYTAFDLFRGVFFVFPMVYLMYYFIDKLFKPRFSSH